MKNIGLPRIPRLLSLPLVSLFLLLRSMYYFVMRVFICEPFFKAHCASYGRNLHTGVFLHWIQGRGEIIAGDNVLIDGKCSFTFAARFSDKPTLILGDNTGISHGCTFTIGKKVTIGRHCRIAGNVWIFDSPGHPADPAARMAGLPPADDEVKPVVIEDNVWIGRGAIIMPGVTVGQNSIVVASAVVMSDVPANTMVAGNPARLLRKLGATGNNI
jgi:acetyltransferase-like isoleucine patch superfamily enzyme